jgi:hypothetical protein
MSDPQQPRARAHELARVLLAAPDQAACDACLDNLEAYVDAQLEGREYTRELAETAAHLDSCVSCSQLYAVLYTTRLEELQGALPIPPATPVPDLSFLRPAPTLAELLARSLEQVGGRLRLTLGQALLDLLQAAPSQPGLAFRDDAGDPLFTLELPAPAPSVERLTLAAYLEADAPGVCLVQVQVELPGRTWPALANVPVRISARGTEQRALTDPWGEASFEQVPLLALPGMVVEVEAP